MNKEYKLMLLEQLQKPIVRYFIMASFVVVVELAVFALLNSSLGVSYVIATPLSGAVAIALNWYLSRKLVFKETRHKIHVEAGLIITTSIVGIGIQLVVTSFCVEILNLLPFVGKVIAIIVAFFWNYWIRKRYIFKS